MLETESEKPVDVYQTLDCQPTQKRDILMQLVVYSLSNPLHTYSERRRAIIFMMQLVHTKPSQNKPITSQWNLPTKTVLLNNTQHNYILSFWPEERSNQWQN